MSRQLAWTTSTGGKQMKAVRLSTQSPGSGGGSSDGDIYSQIGGESLIWVGYHSLGHPVLCHRKYQISKII